MQYKQISRLQGRGEVGQRDEVHCLEEMVNNGQWWCYLGGRGVWSQSPSEYVTMDGVKLGVDGARQMGVDGKPCLWHK